MPSCQICGHETEREDGVICPNCAESVARIENMELLRQILWHLQRVYTNSEYANEAAKYNKEQVEEILEDCARRKSAKDPCGPYNINGKRVWLKPNGDIKEEDGCGPTGSYPFF